MTMVSFAYKMKGDLALQLGMNTCGDVNTQDDWNKMMGDIVDARPGIDPATIIILNIQHLKE